MKINLIDGENFEQVKEVCKDEFFKTKPTRDIFSELNRTTESWTIELTHKDKHIDSCVLLATYDKLPVTIEIGEFDTYFPKNKINKVYNSVFISQFDEDFNLIDSKQYGHMHHQDFNR